MIQLLLDPPHPAEERLDLFEQQIPPQLLRSRGQFQLAEPHQTLLGPKSRLFRWDDAGASEQRANVFLARVRLAITWLRQLLNSRQVRTSSEGTCTVGVSPR